MCLDLGKAQYVPGCFSRNARLRLLFLYPSSSASSAECCALFGAVQFIRARKTESSYGLFVRSVSDLRRSFGFHSGGAESCPGH